MSRKQLLDDLMDSLLSSAIEAMKDEPSASEMAQAINLLKMANYEVVPPGADTKPEMLKSTLEELQADMELDEDVVVPFDSRAR